MQAKIESMKTFLECPVCMERPKSKPIFQCDSGHIHCNECHLQIKTCPICRSKRCNSRCLIAEKVIEDGRPFEKISVPEITDKVRYSNTNQVYQFLQKTNKMGNGKSFLENMYAKKNMLERGKKANLLR